MKSSLRNMVLSLGGISIAVAAVLGTVHSLTERPIAEAAARQAVEAVADVLPRFDNDPIAAAVESDGCTVYPATLDGLPVGAAVRVVTMDGFAGRIEIIVGFDTDCRLTGYTIMEQAETPGLGANADEWFRTEPHSVIGSRGRLVVSKDAAPAASDSHTGASQQHETDTYSGASQQHTADTHTGASAQHHGPADETIDGITAATITSRAFACAINRAREAYRNYLTSY